MAIVDQPKQPLRVLERHTGSSTGEQQPELSTAARDVLAERRRQIEGQVPALGVPISVFNLFICLFIC